jgi:hypothetical protein
MRCTGNPAHPMNLRVAVATNHWDVNRNCRHPHFNQTIMADITKCTNEACPIKRTCHRWIAPADPLWQAYQRFEYWEGISTKCDHYIPDHKIPVHESAPFNNIEQPQKVNTTPSNSRELE